MKKRILALVGAAVLALSMSMTAFATPSTEVGDVIIVDKDGNTVNSGAIKVENGISNKYKPAKKDFDLDELIEGTDYEDSEWVPVGEKEVIEVGAADGLYPISVEFDADDFASAPLIFAFSDGEWVLLDVQLVDGKYVIELDGETALLIYEKVAQGGAAGETDKEEGGSPQTGDATSFVWAGVALAAVLVAAVARRKMA